MMVPQERTLCLDSTVTENVVLGLEADFGAGFLRGDEAAGDCGPLGLALVAGEPRADRARWGRVRDLGVADQQLVEIARALAQGGAVPVPERSARVLVLDEPTSSLGHDDAARLFARVHALEGVGACVSSSSRISSAMSGRTPIAAPSSATARWQGHGDPKTTAPRSRLFARCSAASSEATRRARRLQRERTAAKAADL